MTKQDFIAIGDALRRVGQKSGARFEWLQCVQAIADEFAASNPRFDRERWYRYVCGDCGPSGGRKRKPEVCLAHFSPMPCPICEVENE